MLRVSKLPKDVLKKIQYVEFTPEEEDIQGIVWLNDDWVFEDGSHCESFLNRSDLIYELRHFTIKVYKVD